jgi:membrane carboxypeptidase/penicillin-binding protein PbpC
MRNNNMRCVGTDSRWYQLWRMKDAFVTNEKGRVMDVSGSVDQENRNIVAQTLTRKINQQWDIVYVDEWPEEPKKGQMSPRFGLYVERDFYIVSAMGKHRYLDILNNRNMVIKTQNGRKTQVWYFDQRSRTIKTRLNNQSWDIRSSGRTKDMQIWSTNSGWFQIFQYSDNQFINMQDRRVLDVLSGKDQEGQPTIVWKNHKGANQRWNVIYVDEADKIKTKGLSKDFGFMRNRPFYIRSRLPMKRVAECVGANNVQIKRWRKNVAAQQWFFDPVSKTVKNNYWKTHSLDMRNNNVRCIRTDSRWYQLWRSDAAFVVNEKGRVLDVAGAADQENRNIIAHPKHGRINQQWDIVYADEWKGEPGKGELNEDFGLYVERDFHVVSQLSEHRYLSIPDNTNMVVKHSNTQRYQVWYFDQKSLTIKSRNTNRSWDIHNRGRTNLMKVYNTNSGWW